MSFNLRAFGWQISFIPGLRHAKETIFRMAAKITPKFFFRFFNVLPAGKTLCIKRILIYLTKN